MNSAVSYLIEPFLKQFFLIDAVCRGFIDETRKREIFEELARIFCVPLGDETEEYFATATSAGYDSITDYAQYERFCRMIEFAEISGQEMGITPIDRVVMAQKREAMYIKSTLFGRSKGLTEDIIADTLFDTAMNGNIDAMSTLSYMEYHGLCVPGDVGNAKRRLSLCAKWNDLFGNLMGIAYDIRGKRECYNRLYTILKSSNQREVFRHICMFTSFEDSYERCPVARIIEKAFSLGIIQRNTYDRGFAKVAFSRLISSEDKEKLLWNKKSDAIVSLSDIPFGVDRDTEFEFDERSAQNTPLKREAEMHKILCGISPAVNGRSDLYRTLLVAGSDEYIADMYMLALARGFGKKGKLFEVDAGTLLARDFAPAKEHFILRGLSETKRSHTVFLMKHCDELEEDELEQLIKLLDHEYRRKFKLMDPTVSLDLSDVLIILFSSTVNESVKNLAQECDVVWTERLNDAEKEIVIESIFKERSDSFGVEGAKLCDDAKQYLKEFETGRVVRIIDGALKKAAYDSESAITAESLRKIAEAQNYVGDRREFGYLGGAIL